MIFRTACRLMRWLTIMTERAQLLQLIGKQRHAQLSDLVIDSRPALAMRGWADEDAEFGRRAELRAFGKEIPENADKLDFETTSASAAFSTPIVNQAAIKEAIFDYDRAATLLWPGQQRVRRAYQPVQGKRSKYINRIAPPPRRSRRCFKAIAIISRR